MALFNRRKNSREETNGDGDHNSEGKKEKGGWKKPANTAFKQQRLKAWQPILTPKTVLPILLIIGLLFAPIGALLIWGNGTVSQITLPYTGCDSAGSNFSELPKSNYQLRASDSKLAHDPPLWRFDNSTGSSTCIINFHLPADLQKPVFIYYKLTNFYQNHRRYVKSLNTDQLSGKYVSPSKLQDSDCKPLGSINQTLAVYPCGLIANSQFNDTIRNPILLNPEGGGPSTPYNFSFTGIAWPGEKKKYVAKPAYNFTEMVPPPNWHDRFPNGYTEENLPDLSTDEHFQNWMRTAGLPTFSKLWGRNDDQDMLKGTYSIEVDMHFPVSQFGGTKSLVISTIAWSGGKNAFLGWAYIGAASLFVLLFFIGMARHFIKPRRLGDMNLLSWNQPNPPR